MVISIEEEKTSITTDYLMNGPLDYPDFPKNILESALNFLFCAAYIFEHLHISYVPDSMLYWIQFENSAFISD